MNILITGIGGPTPLGIAKSLKLGSQDYKIFGVDASPYAPGHFDDHFDKTFVVPVASEENYWDTINEIVINNGIDFAFIVPETEVLEWAKYSKLFTLPCKALLPDFDVANFLFDKLLVSNFLYNYNLTPKTIPIHNEAIVNKHELDSLGYPFWLRINKTAGASGAMKINKSEDLLDWIKLNGNAEFIASTFLPGRNYAAKILFSCNEVILTAAGERIEYLMPNISPTKISGMCARGRLINDPSLIEKAEFAIRTIFDDFGKGINGMFTVDFKEDINGNPLITEINIRHVSFTHAFSLAGANFPLKTLENIFGNKFSERVDFIFEKEFDFIRGVDYPLRLIKNPH